MVSSLLLGLVMVQADEPRDVKLPVMPIWQFADWVEGVTGRDVIVLPEIQDRLVYVNVKQRTIREVLVMVKEAVGVEVLDRNGVLTMRKSPDGDSSAFDRPEDYQESFEALVTEYWDQEKLAKEFGEKSELLQKHRKSGLQQADFGKYQELQAGNPIAIAANRLVKRLGLNGMMSIPDNEMVVYSTHPTRLQRAWLGNAVTDMDRLTEAMELRNVVAKAFQADKASQMGYVLDYSPIEESRGGKDQPVEKLIVELRKSEFGYRISARAYTSAGELISGNTNNFEPDQTVNFSNMEGRFAVEFGDFPEKMVLTEAQRQDIDRVTALFGQSGRNFSDDDIRWFASIGEKEPLGGAITDVMDWGLAQTGSEAVLEVWIPMVFQRVGNEFSVAQAMTLIHTQSMSREMPAKKNELLIGRPMPEFFRKLLAPRQALAGVAQQILDQGRLTLDDLALGIMRLQVRDQVQLFVPGVMAMSGQDSGNSSMSEPRGWREYNLLGYAGLSVDQRRKVFEEGGLTIPVGSLDSASARMFWETVRSVGPKLVNFNSWAVGVDGKMVRKPGELSRWDMEPTVFLARSDLGEITLTWRGQKSNGFAVGWSHSRRGEDTFETVSFSGMEQLASTLAMYEEIGPDDGYTPPKMTGLVEAERDRLELTVNWGTIKGAIESFEMFGRRPGPRVAIADLPPTIRSEFDLAMVRARENQRGSGGKVIPPR